MFPLKIALTILLTAVAVPGVSGARAAFVGFTPRATAATRYGAPTHSTGAELNQPWTPVGWWSQLGYLLNIRRKRWKITILRGKNIYKWSVFHSKQFLIGGLEHFSFFHILGIIIPTDSHFSEGLQKPTRLNYQRVGLCDILLG